MKGRDDDAGSVDSFREVGKSVKEVDIVALGNRRLITPAGGAWDGWFDGPAATDDFMVVREQPTDK